MKVLFLILNYKTYQETIKLVEKLYDEGLNDYYVLIVDNASPNDSYSEIYSAVGTLEKVEVIRSPENGGFAKGNNFGLRYAKKYNPQYVCIINNDVLFNLKTIDNLIKWYEKLSTAAFIAPRQILPNGADAPFNNLDVPTIWKDLYSYFPYKKKFVDYKDNCGIQGVHEVGLIPGAFIFAEYAKFDELGFFDESTFLFCEERIIAKRAELAGFKSYIVTGDTYIHNHSTTINSEASKKKQRRLILEGRCI